MGGGGGQGGRETRRDMGDSATQRLGETVAATAGYCNAHSNPLCSNAVYE